MSHISDEQLALYVGGDLKEEDFRNVEKHLQRCAECRVSYAEFQDSAAALRVGFGEPAAEDLRGVRQVVVQRLRKRKGVARQWALVAATAAAAIVAVVLLFHGKQPPRVTTNSLAITTAYLRIPYQPLVEPSIPNLAVSLEHARITRHHPAPGLRNVTLLAERDGPPILKMTTSDPDVVILWQLDERTQRP